MQHPIQPQRSPQPLPQRPQRRMARRDRNRNYLLAFGFLALAFILVAMFMFTLPDVSQATRFAPGNAVQIFDRASRLVTTIEGNEERQFAPIRSVPIVMQQAMLAAEDHTFYEHGGLSIRGIARALLANMGAGRVVEGGSTITQQLAKILFFDNSDRSVFRKIREAVVALQLEDKLSKKEILEAYLNQVYFGRGAFGIEQASLAYFGKHTSQLALPEAAFLAGVVRAPSIYSDRKNLNDAMIRQHEVLDQMAELHFVPVAAADRAKETPLRFTRSVMPNRKFPYYISAVMDFLRTQMNPADLARGGLRVYTNMDPVAQTLAERTLARAQGTVPPAMNEAGLVSVLVEDGSVVALVGGMGDYWKHQWNAATHPHTMGSAFKPFVYLTGFMQGAFTPETRIDDSPIVVKQPNGVDYQPKNFDDNFLGPITIRTAIADSRNVCAVKAAAAAGIDNVIHTAHAAGITSRLEPTIALALGASAASPLEMAGAYSTFARGGSAVTPSLVRRVENRTGGLLKDFTQQGSTVFDPRAVKELVSCLQSVVQEGTGTQAQLAGRPVAGKTGTSDEGRDLWFVGFTSDMVTAVWGGNGEHKSVGSNVTGGTVVARLWHDYNQAYYRARPRPAGSFGETPNKNIFDALLKPQASSPDKNSDPFKPLISGPQNGDENSNAQNADGTTKAGNDKGKVNNENSDSGAATWHAGEPGGRDQADQQSQQDQSQQQQQQQQQQQWQQEQAQQQSQQQQWQQEHARRYWQQRSYDETAPPEAPERTPSDNPMPEPAPDRLRQPVQPPLQQDPLQNMLRPANERQ